MSKNSWYPTILILSIIGLLVSSASALIAGRTFTLGLGAAQTELKPDLHSVGLLALIVVFLGFLVTTYYLRSKSLSKRVAAVSLLLAALALGVNAANTLLTGTRLILDVTPLIMLVGAFYLWKDARSDEV